MKTKNDVLNDVSKRYGFTSFQTCLEKLAVDSIPTANVNTIVRKSMDEYAGLKVAEAESKNLKQADVIRPVCGHPLSHRVFSQMDGEYCRRCGERYSHY